MMEQNRSNSYLFGGNAPYVEEMYEAYLENPGSVPDTWRAYFDALQHVPAADGSDSRDVPHAPVIESFAQRAKANAFAVKASSTDLAIARKQVHVQSLIAAYRFLGSRWADLDPLKRTERPRIPELDPAFYDLTEADMDITFSATNTYFSTNENMTLRQILQALRETYCGTIGAEFMHITDPGEKRWWQERIEAIRSKPTYNAEEKKHILDRLTAAEGLERYLHTKFVGQKRFSLEGGESFIVSMDELVQRAGVKGVQEIVIGMAHRGRLNVLVNTLGKMPKDLFAEFDHTAPEDLPSGDVKYHQGFSSDITTAGGPVHLSLAFNPSHLEIVNPVVEGSVKARMDRRGDHKGAAGAARHRPRRRGLRGPGRGHGDAGAGADARLLHRRHGPPGHQQPDRLHHVRPARHALHAVLHRRRQDDRGAGAARQRRRSGSRRAVHAARARLSPAVQQGRGRRHRLLPQAGPQRAGHAQPDAAADVQEDRRAPGHAQAVRRQAGRPGRARRRPARDDMVKEFRAAMDAGRHTRDPVLTNFKGKYAVDWSPFLNKKWTDAADTALPVAEFKRLAERITTIPSNFKLHPLVEKVIADRAAMGRGEINVDWGMGEHMAFASLVASGYPIRLSGEDSGRGTFTHRHAVLHDQNREKFDTGTYTPLQNVTDKQAPFVVIDSLLSEEAVLAFEFGYASSDPNTLVIWEAQFGDFVNGAQVVIDQFIASGEVKWGRANGLTLMLPHGYEGQGPEHSSARLERFMQLSADTNMQVVQPTTASQIFHLLRRQMVRAFRKPLVIMTPKSLLRNKDATSPMSEFTKGEFRTVIPELDADGRRPPRSSA